jgi:hypothetical protein
MIPVVNLRILAAVGEGGIMKQQYDEPSYDASQIYKTKNYATITFKDSPFRGQKGRILKEIVGRHPELHLEMPGGEKIRVDLLWTDYFGEPSQSPETLIQRIDFSQAQPIIRFLEYLRTKLTEDLASSPAADHSA